MNPVLQREFAGQQGRTANAAFPTDARRAKLDYSFRLGPVTRLFDLPAPQQSFEVRAGGQQCGDEIDGRGTPTRPGGVAGYRQLRGNPPGNASALGHHVVTAKSVLLRRVLVAPTCRGHGTWQHHARPRCGVLPTEQRAVDTGPLARLVRLLSPTIGGGCIANVCHGDGLGVRFLESSKTERFVHLLFRSLALCEFIASPGTPGANHPKNLRLECPIAASPRQSEIAMVRTPDGHGRLEVSRFLAPPVIADHRTAPLNALGYLRVMFTVEDICGDRPARLGKRRAELCAGSFDHLVCS